MNKNTLLLLVGAIALVGIGAWALASPGGPAAPETYSAGALTATETNYDFGTIGMADGDVTRRYTVTNSSAEAVTITEVYTSCMCTEAVIEVGGERSARFGMPGHTATKTSITVAPGKQATVEAIFDPDAHGPAGVGLAERSIWLVTNSQTEPRLELTFRAQVTR